MRRFEPLLLATLIGAGLGFLALPFFGWQVVVIRGASMAPAIPVGAAVVVEQGGKLHRGDVVTVEVSGARLLTHRIVGIDHDEASTWLTTKGDANPSPDPSPVPATAVVGRAVAYVPGAGYVLGVLATPSGWLSVFCLIGSFLCLYRALSLPASPVPLPRPTIVVALLFSLVCALASLESLALFVATTTVPDNTFATGTW